MSLMEITAPAAVCACGSTLDARLCCALEPGQAARLSSSPQFATALTRMAQAYGDGELALAEHLAREALALAPGHRDALGGLYNVCKDTDRVQAAEALVRRMVALHPEDPAVRLNAALFFRKRNALAEALAHGRTLLRLAPDLALPQRTLGQIFIALNQPVSAEQHLRRALELAGGEEDFDALAALAQAVRDQGRFAEARDLFARAVAAGAGLPRAVDPLLAWAELEETDRRFDDADALLDRADILTPHEPRIRVGRAAVLRRRGRPDDAMALLDSLPPAGDRDPVRILAAKERGQVLDALGRHDEAFDAFADFKRLSLELTGAAYAADNAGRLAEQLKTFFTAGRTLLLPRAGRRDDIAQPIFIVGFPRSGTTLVEQTLTTHPAIGAGDELPILANLAERLGGLLNSPGAYPQALSELWTGDRASMIDTLRDLYLNEAARLGAIQPGARWFTDKMPLNETHLGLIHLMFPRSPIIHLTRHPMDVVLSVFGNSLSHGFHCASTLESAARHFVLTAELVEHYRAVLPMRYLAVRYEDMVADQENQVRRLFDFVGEAYDPRSLAFHENPRPARTASYAQVTEKLYDRSRFRFHRYRRGLAPVEPSLTPWIARLGYSLDDR